MMETLIWLVPAAVLVAGLGSPRGGLVALAACLPLFGSPPGGPYLAAFDVAALAAIATAWRAGRASRAGLDWPVWAFVAISGATLIPLAYHPPSWQPRLLVRLLAALPEVEVWTPLYGWRALVSLAIGVGLYGAVKRAFAGRPLRPLWVALGIGVAVTLLLGLAAHAGLIELDGFRTKGGPRWETRLHSLFFHSGWLAEFLIVSVPLAAVGLARSGRRGGWAAAGLVALALPILFLTEQRAAWLTALGQLALAAALWRSALARPRRGRALAAGAVIAVVLVGIGLLAQRDLFSSAIERTRVAFAGEARLFVWDVAAEMSAERPLLGWGLGAFSPVYQRLMGEPRPSGFDWLTAHNQALMLTAERGWLGLAAFVVVLWGLLGSLRAAGRAARPEDGDVVRALWVSLAGFLAYGVFQYMFFLRMIEWLFWMLAGAVAALAPTGPRPRAVERVAQSLLLVAAVLVPWRALAVEPLRVAGDRAFGLHQAERSGERRFQWTTGYAARRLPRPPGSSALELELANGHPRPEDHSVEVVVRMDGREVLRTEAAGEWTSYTLPLEPSDRAWVLVEIEARPTFRPFSDLRGDPELGGSADVRELGVAVAWP